MHIYMYLSSTLTIGRRDLIKVTFLGLNKAQLALTLARWWKYNPLLDAFVTSSAENLLPDVFTTPGASNRSLMLQLAQGTMILPQPSSHGLDLENFTQKTYTACRAENHANPKEQPIMPTSVLTRARVPLMMAKLSITHLYAGSEFGMTPVPWTLYKHLPWILIIWTLMTQIPQKNKSDADHCIGKILGMCHGKFNLTFLARLSLRLEAIFLQQLSLHIRLRNSLNPYSSISVRTQTQITTSCTTRTS